eukprot:SAG31_NODE_1646_length_7649_cov_3.317616_6_plen_91_part_00
MASEISTLQNDLNDARRAIAQAEDSMHEAAQVKARMAMEISTLQNDLDQARRAIAQAEESIRHQDRWMSQVSRAWNASDAYSISSGGRHG